MSKPEQIPDYTNIIAEIEAAADRADKTWDVQHGFTRELTQEESAAADIVGCTLWPRVKDGFARQQSLYESALDQINMLACYASEENTDARADILLEIGKAARAALQAKS